jgi:ribonuclease HII
MARYLKSRYAKLVTEAGCDEAGRGCLAGPVFAAAVILPDGFRHKLLNDSKQMSPAARYTLRPVIEQAALAWGVGTADEQEIDQLNILNATFLAMHRAIRQLAIRPGLLLIDGPRFRNTTGIPHQCLVGGDGRFASIAAASVLAKTYRDDWMEQLHVRIPRYGWDQNKGYGTAAHRAAIREYGLSEYHRKTFRLKSGQPVLDFREGHSL